MTTINPYLSFNGNCEEAFNFYKSIFGGDFTYVGRYKEMPKEFEVKDHEKEQIMHISLPISKETILMGSDTSESFGLIENFGDNFSVSVGTDSKEEADRLFNSLSEGGKITMPIQKTFWGDYFGSLTDKFGFHWMVSCEYNEDDNNE